MYRTVDEILVKMRKLIIAFIFAGTLLGLGITACRKGESQDGPKSAGLTGKWELREVLLDPGDGSGRFREVPSSERKLLVLKSDGTVAGEFFSKEMHYEVVDSLWVNFTYGGQISAYLYKVTSGTLQLSGGGCIEACSYKFVRKSRE